MSVHGNTNTLKAIAWMTGTLLSFSLMAICVRELSGEILTPQMLLIRSAIGLVFISILLLLLRKKASVQTNKISLHVFRNIFHFAGQYGWFLGIGLLPLAEVFALEFTAPLWTLIIASIWLKEEVTIQKILSVLVGLVGVVTILKPGIEIVELASLIVIASAICYGVAHTSTKALTSSESALSILFYMCLIQLPIGLVLSITNWTWPSNIQWLWLGVIGLTALSAHYCMTNAMQHATATTVVTIDFLRLPLIAGVGVYLYSEKLEISLLLGGLLMLLANVISLKNTHKQDN